MQFITVHEQTASSVSLLFGLYYTRLAHRVYDAKAETYFRVRSVNDTTSQLVYIVHQCAVRKEPHLYLRLNKVCFLVVLQHEGTF